MRFTVTGASGFLGRHLCRKLTGLGHEVIAVHRGSCEPLGRELAVRNVTFDMDSGEALPADALDSDAILHLAWPALSDYNASLHYESALPRSYELVRRYVEGGGRQVLIVGTCFEYGLRNGKLSEWMTPDPQNPYAVAKDTLRRFVTFLKARRSFTLQWVRLFYVHGPGQHRRTLLSQLDAAIDRGDSSFDMSPGDQLRDYLPIEEAARRVSILAQRPELDGIFNCCSGKPVSIRALVEERIRNRGARITLNLGHYPHSPLEPMAFWGDAEKTRELFAP